MRTCLAVFCFLVLFTSPVFSVYLEAERLLESPDAVYRWFDPWLPLVMILCSSVITLALPWIVGALGHSEDNE